ncbi:hypothetical protein FNV43_RR02417 [Rhamnella rubrinervis]|uniref:PDZ domain-containing protein n=1 Tax=Rhamnella rubrinervis TaxID=2594499 RepID=A0A8K0HT08_9ROSA|nr:hypothetical protein FNV43_RR02417 [Rhamnella rubrinervis]
MEHIQVLKPSDVILSFDGVDIANDGIGKCGFDVVANILSERTKLQEYKKGGEKNPQQVELDAIQDYIKESDNLVSLCVQIHDCDGILSQMETLLRFIGQLCLVLACPVSHSRIGKRATCALYILWTVVFLCLCRPKVEQVTTEDLVKLAEIEK